MPEPITVDPRPRVRDRGDGSGAVEGIRCTNCGEVAAFAWPRCPACGGEVRPAVFGPAGTVWSATVVRIPVPGRTPPYALAYVDLDDGPRILAHVVGETGDAAVPIGARVRVLAGTDSTGDVLVEVTA